MNAATYVNDSSVAPDGAWTDAANCADVPVRLFFSGDETDQREALRLCADCPVRQPCLTYAVQNGEMYGIWGGTTESERRTLIRDARRRARERKRAA